MLHKQLAMLHFNKYFFSVFNIQGVFIKHWGGGVGLVGGFNLIFF